MDARPRRRVRVLVTGTVQGVSFRRFTQREAVHLGLSGWERNLRDGRVEAEVEGPAFQVEGLLAVLRRGPPHALVTDVSAEDLPPTGRDVPFDVLPTAE
jgi:acylphosphatase